MTIYTPRGLKVRVPVPVAFTLVARLAPSVSAFELLKTTEAFASMPAMFGFITGILAILGGLSPTWLVAAVVVARLAGMGLQRSTSQVLVRMATAYSWIEGYGIFLGLGALLAFLVRDRNTAIAYVVAGVLSSLLQQALDMARADRFFRAGYGANYESELSFWSAYHYHARRVGASCDTLLTQDEVSTEVWKSAFLQFRTEWPRIVSRGMWE